MIEAKPTPGPWVIHPTALHPAVRSVGTGEIGPRRICTVGSMNGNPVDKANASLIAEAGTVFHTTGLTPSQLVERVKELEEALHKLAKSYERGMQLGAPPSDALKAARAALSKARPNTAEGEAK
ncbi:hypothetical protein [Acidovorax sp. Leaf73]|uniref:hypothetical protein n=1 Tax=Acidovorax sp. Leaf73 TaxID=2876566 RepID=UPI001E393E01|nr:hypothetical protein [Acidovorax sp. Leaf73]